ncbi:MAG TPA: NUDIX domain-containing protein, partial [Woeseiaceae bacterium]|nr:NUDIX domain-containing protein [Woeseiaceae bacterium]
ERRPAAGIWGGLWSLPEAGGERPEDWCEQRLGVPAAATQRWETLRHSFSHYDLDIRPVVLQLAGPPRSAQDSDDAVWYRPGDTPPGGIAAPVRKLLDKLLLEPLTAFEPQEFEHVANG